MRGFSPGFCSLLLLVLATVLFSCQKEPLPATESPRVSTHAISDISELGAVFHGEIENPEGEEIVGYGFVWQKEREPGNSSDNKKLLNPPLQNGKFSASISSTLEPYKEYYVRAFIKTRDKTIYGIVKSFTSLGSQAPEAFTMQPKSGVWGDTVLIKGNHFSYQKKENHVKFGAQEAIVLSSTDTTLLVQAPPLHGNGNVEVSFGTAGYWASNHLTYTYLLPEINSFSPGSGTFGDIVLLKGLNFSLSPETKVYLKTDKYNSTSAAVISISKSTISFAIPYEISSSNPRIEVVSSGVAVEGPNSFYLLPPQISSFSPDTVKSAEQLITLYGENFNPDKEMNRVMVDMWPVDWRLTLETATDTSLQFKLPAFLFPEEDSATHALLIGVLVAGQGSNVKVLHVQNSNQ